MHEVVQNFVDVCVPCAHGDQWELPLQQAPSTCALDSLYQTPNLNSKGSNVRITRNKSYDFLCWPPSLRQRSSTEPEFKGLQCSLTRNKSYDFLCWPPSLRQNVLSVGGIVAQKETATVTSVSPTNCVILKRFLEGKSLPLQSRTASLLRQKKKRILVKLSCTFQCRSPITALSVLLQPFQDGKGTSKFGNGEQNAHDRNEGKPLIPDSGSECTTTH